MAKGDTAIHAARRLLAQLFFLHVVVELVPIANALYRGTVQRELPQIL
jgi:hypothetical protein